MHKEILNKDQSGLLNLLPDFKKSYYLVEGTAIALQIGHRQSIDFDLFTKGEVNHKKIIEKFSKNKLSVKITRRTDTKLNLICNHVNFTFYQYPYDINPNLKFQNYCKMPDLIQLAAMKAFALGRRSKWKDYVDLYFLLKEKLTVKDITAMANQIYGDLFSEKQFRAQLMYFKDIDYTEEVIFLRDFPKKKEIMKFLTEIALDF